MRKARGMSRDTGLAGQGVVSAVTIGEDVEAWRRIAARRWYHAGGGREIPGAPPRCGFRRTGTTRAGDRAGHRGRPT